MDSLTQTAAEWCPDSCRKAFLWPGDLSSSGAKAFRYKAESQAMHPPYCPFPTNTLTHLGSFPQQHTRPSGVLCLPLRYGTSGSFGCSGLNKTITVSWCISASFISDNEICLIIWMGNWIIPFNINVLFYESSCHLSLQFDVSKFYNTFNHHLPQPSLFFCCGLQLQFEYFSPKPAQLSPCSLPVKSFSSMKTSDSEK